MGKSVRFLSRSVLEYLGGMLALFAVVLAGCYVTGVPAGADNLFRNYYTAMPLMAIMFLFIHGFGICTSSLSLALSLGAKRRDYFWGAQVVMVLEVAAVWAIMQGVSALPRLGGWAQPGRFLAASAWTGGVVFLVVCFAAVVLGCLCGPATAKSRWLGAGIMLAAFLVLLMGSVLMMIFGDADLWSFLSESAWGGLWGVLPGVLMAVLLLAILGGEVAIWRYIGRFVVR